MGRRHQAVHVTAQLALPLLLVAACGCDSKPAPAPAASAARAPDPAPVALPPSTSCKLSAKLLPPADPTLGTRLRLRLGTHGSVWAQVGEGASATLTLPKSGQLAAVEASYADVRVAALTKLDEAPLHPARALVFAKQVVPLANAVLSVSSDGSGLSASYSPPLRLSSKLSPRRVGCADLALELAEFDAAAAAKLPEPESEVLLPSEPFTLAAEESKSEGIEFPALPRGLVGKLHAERGQRAQVSFSLKTALFFGWLDRRLLRPAPGSPPAAHVPPPEEASIPTQKQPQTCVRDLTLVGELAKEKVKVGKIPRGAPFETRPVPGAEWVSVQLHWPAPWLVLSPGGRLLVRASDLAECR